MRDGRQALLKAFQGGTVLTTTVLARRFSVTRQAIHRQLASLVRQGSIVRLGSSKKKSFYVLNSPSVIHKVWKSESQVYRRTLKTKGLEEDLVYSEIKTRPHLLTALGPEAASLFHYAFTEMLNNSIDHSQAPRVRVSLHANPQTTSFEITDHGVGAFENIRSKRNLNSEQEALQDLLKGRQTTMPERHSGEGIFFTSKAVDRFVLESHKKRFIVDNRIGDIFVEDVRFKQGTRVVCEVDNRTSRKIEDIFRQYTNEDFEFDKSCVSVKLYREGELYVSRSQAKRLLHSLERFREIVLDFSGVTTIGQGFADEIFRVFQNQHPEIRIIPIHCHENVDLMIHHAKSARQLA